MKFSVLLSCYFRDNCQELAVALKSIWDDQTVKPSEIVIVKDGPLTPELDATIDDFTKRAPVKLVPLKENKGLGLALAEGLEHCSYEYVARMDGDDISVPDRFEKQVAFIEQHPQTAICGGMIQEFSDSPENVTGKRMLPTTHQDIMKFVSKRSPFNHVTVFLKKQAILDAGNYQHIPSYEDYWLWARVLASGHKGSNLPDILVNVRAGENMLQRRRGWSFFKTEVDLAKKLNSLKLLSFAGMIRNILLRGGIRLLPTFVLKIVYSYLREK